MVARGNGDVFSPALYPDAVRIWDRAGFRPFAGLDVMERPIGRGMTPPTVEVSRIRTPDWEALVSVDNTAFDGFWRMNQLGLLEAMSATPRSTILQVEEGGAPIGYALVGAQMTTAFLQRVAVDPTFSGRGLGTSLVRASLAWAGKMGARAMVLNVRPDNPRARDLYLREGFDLTGARLSLLRFDGAGSS
jgi:ribosomal-protein-alanine N-acetyltransferase